VTSLSVEVELYDGKLGTAVFGRGLLLCATGDGSRKTTVSSSSKISLIRSLARLTSAGGVGVRFAFAFLFPDFREKMPDVQVWYLRFFTLPDRSGETFDLDRLLAGGSRLRDDSGSRGFWISALGVGVGEMPGEFDDQKCFRLVGGLPDAVIAGEPDADSGRFGRLIAVSAFSARAGPENSRVVASAVLGRSRGLSVSGEIGELIVRTDFGVGLAAMELMLPDSECPRIVEQLVSVSDEINDNGRGIISTLSANPTRGRAPGALSLRLGEAGGERLV
jgi:hypothetical protein